MSKDFFDASLSEVLVVRVFPEDKERLEEIVKDQEKYENVAHAVRCAIQAFIKRWGDV